MPILRRSAPTSLPRRLVLFGTGALVFAFVAVIWLGFFTPLPGEEQHAIAGSRNQSLYVKMEDGTPIAVDLWFPPSLAKGGRVPALMHATRYWRAREATFARRLMYGIGLTSEDSLIPNYVQVFNARGYVVVEIDARGSGASFGSRPVELGPQEVDDYGQLADWIAEQDWSNSNVGTFGISYNGNTAELALASKSKAIRAIAPQFSDFDFQSSVLQPGGVPMDFVPLWGEMVAAMDANNVCQADGVTGWDCIIASWVKGGIKPVDGSDGPAMLASAIEQHRGNADIENAFANVRYRDDVFGESDTTISQLNSYGNKEAIEASGAPMQVWASWFDANTTAGALSRYASFSNPQHLIIGPFSHGGLHDADPLQPDDAPPVRSPREQYELMANFFDRHLKQPQNTSTKTGVSYFTLGKRRWCWTEAWPPVGIEQRQYFLRVGNRLQATPNGDGFDTYRVDFDHSGPLRNRWMTNLDYGDVIYGDRSEADEHLLTYTSDPLESEMIVTGSPVLRLQLASDRPKFTIHAYFEGVKPSGKSYHIAEAVLLSEFYALSSQPSASDIFGSPRSFHRADARLPLADNVIAIELSMTPVSIALPKGHRLRISLAGSDSSMFPRNPEKGEVNWTLHYGEKSPSLLALPVEGPISCNLRDPFLPVEN